MLQMDTRISGKHKARLVAGGHLTPDPIESIYLVLSQSDPLGWLYS